MKAERKAPRLRRQGGQSLVETAITLPILLTLALGVIDIGRAFYYREAVVNAARQAARLAASRSYQSTANSYCAAQGNNPATVTTNLPPSGGGLNSLGTLVSQESSGDGTAANSAISGATLSVTWHCTGGAAVTNATNGGSINPSSPASDSVSVSITYQLSLITPFVYPLTGPQFTLTQSEIQRVEY